MPCPRPRLLRRCFRNRKLLRTCPLPAPKRKVNQDVPQVAASSLCGTSRVHLARRHPDQHGQRKSGQEKATQELQRRGRLVDGQRWGLCDVDSVTTWVFSFDKSFRAQMLTATPVWCIAFVSKPSRIFTRGWLIFWLLVLLERCSNCLTRQQIL